MITLHKTYYVPRFNVRVVTIGLPIDELWECELLDDPQEWFSGENPVFFHASELQSSTHYLIGAYLFGMLFLLAIAAMLFGGQ